VLNTVHDYHKQYELMTGTYVPQSPIFSVYMGDPQFESFALVPEVSNIILSPQHHTVKVSCTADSCHI